MYALYYSCVWHCHESDIFQTINYLNVNNSIRSFTRWASCVILNTHVTTRVMSSVFVFTNGVIRRVQHASDVVTNKHVVHMCGFMDPVVHMCVLKDYGEQKCRLLNHIEHACFHGLG